jgi:uncharacterized damage-inducible protein DinB
MNKKLLKVSSLTGYPVEIGRWLWALEDVRRTLLLKLTGINQKVLDTKMDGRQSIGSLLYHIAMIEADWLYDEVLCKEWDSQIRALFPFEVSSKDGSLTHIQGQSLEEHLDRLQKVREVFLTSFHSIDLEEWRKPRVLDQYDVTPEWVVYHLIEHESHHRGQIFQMLRLLQEQ